MSDDQQIAFASNVIRSITGKDGELGTRALEIWKNNPDLAPAECVMLARKERDELPAGITLRDVEFIFNSLRAATEPSIDTEQGMEPEDCE